MDHELAIVGIGQAIIIENRASPHTARATQVTHRELYNFLMWWPANLPDLNPIENIWRILKYRIQKRFPKTRDELIRYIQEEWDKLSVQDIQKYCRNMGERCTAVLEHRGDMQSIKFCI